MRYLLLCFLLAVFQSCQTTNSNTLSIGFLDAFEDETIAQAKKGFFVALKDSGYSPDSNLKVLYRNAQGDIPALSQSVDFFTANNVDLIVTNTTLSTISAAKRNTTTPICMMVSPSPELAGLRGPDGKDPENLMGVYETLEYIDTALALIPQRFPGKTKVGTLINQSEPQSRDALARIEKEAARLGLQIVMLPANSSAETQLVTQQLISQGIQVFFALPDNTIFASFETIAAACHKAGIPVVTSESGLVARGADVAFGADIYQWGYDAGLEAIRFFKTRQIPKPVKLRKRSLVVRDTTSQNR